MKIVAKLIDITWFAKRICPYGPHRLSGPFWISHAACTIAEARTILGIWARRSTYNKRARPLTPLGMSRGQRFVYSLRNSW